MLATRAPLPSHNPEYVGSHTSTIAANHGMYTNQPPTSMASYHHSNSAMYHEPHQPYVHRPYHHHSPPTRTHQIMLATAPMESTAAALTSSSIPAPAMTSGTTTTAIRTATMVSSRTGATNNNNNNKTQQCNLKIHILGHQNHYISVTHTPPPQGGGGGGAMPASTPNGVETTETRTSSLSSSTASRLFRRTNTNANNDKVISTYTVRCDQPLPAECEIFELIHYKKNVYHLRTHHGTFLSADKNGLVMAHRRYAKKEERWKCEACEGFMAFKSKYGKYLSSQLDGTLVADRKEIGLWEKFRVQLLPGTQFLLYSPGHGTYVTLGGGATTQISEIQREGDANISKKKWDKMIARAKEHAEMLHANREHADGTPETIFIAELAPCGTNAIQASNGKFLTVDHNKKGYMRACSSRIADNTTSILQQILGEPHSFMVEIHSRNRVAFRTLRNRYISADARREGNLLVANRRHCKKWEKFQVIRIYQKHLQQLQLY